MPIEAVPPSRKPPRSPALYRVVIAIPLLMAMYLIASGRFAEYWRYFAERQHNAIDEHAFNSAFISGILWMVSVTPLVLAAWELGVRRTAARRTGFELFAGLKDVFRIAFWGRPGWESVNQETALDRPPADRRVFALVQGGGVAIAVPIFFASVGPPPLRTPGAIAWLIGAGLLMGGAVYCHQRAAAYLRDEPKRFDVFGQWRRLNPNRYDGAGRVFVRWQIGLTIALMIWWLFVDAMVLFSST